MDDVKLVLEAPDAAFAAAILTTRPFYMGKGDRTAFLEVVLNSDPKTIPDLKGKLRLLMTSKVGKEKIYNDKLCSTTRLKKQLVYRLWLHTVRRHGVLNVQDFLDLYPYHEEYLRILDRHVDADGKTTLNTKEYMIYRDVKRKEAEKNKKKKIAKKTAVSKIK